MEVPTWQCQTCDIATCSIECSVHHSPQGLQRHRGRGRLGTTDLGSKMVGVGRSTDCCSACASGCTATSRTLYCYDCNVDVPTALAFGRHRRAVHNVRRLGVKYAGEDGICNACGHLFHNTRRLVQHLNFSSRQCLATLIGHSKPYSDAQIAVLDKKLRKTGKGVARIADKPAIRVEGPLFKPPTQYDIDLAAADGVAPSILGAVPAATTRTWSIPRPTEGQPLIVLSLCSGLRRQSDPH